MKMASQLENLKFLRELFEGHQGQDQGNRGQSLRKTPGLPSTTIQVFCLRFRGKNQSHLMHTVQKLQENRRKATGLMGTGLVATVGKPVTER